MAHKLRIVWVLLLFRFVYLFMYNILPACMNVYAENGVEERVENPMNLGWLQATTMCTDLNPDLVQKQKVFLTAERSLQHHFCGLFF